MAQNIYDDPDFFRAYSGLPRSVEGLDGAPEWSTLRALLPDVSGLRLVDLGCGFGWFCRWAAESGAAHVFGLDLSERMLERAVVDTADPRVTYERQDLDRLDLPTSAFDVAYSSLTLHYLADLDRLFTTVHTSLAPDGTFVFSVEHPICTAPSAPEFVTDANGRVTWPLDGYLAEGPRTTDWLVPGVVKQHRTIETYVSAVLAAGFALRALREWGPSEEQIAQVPAWRIERERPYFLLIAADRR